MTHVEKTEKFVLRVEWEDKETGEDHQDVSEHESVQEAYRAQYAARNIPGRWNVFTEIIKETTYTERIAWCG